MELSAPPASPNGIAANSAAAAWTGGGSSSERLRLFDPELAESLGQLARLMANVTDAYTAGIFLSDAVFSGSGAPSAGFPSPGFVPPAGATNSSSASSPATAFSPAKGSTADSTNAPFVLGTSLASRPTPQRVQGSGREIVRSDEGSRQTLELVAFHTLSREVIPHARIAYGSGLVGWTAENGVRISVCPFENDSTTLLFYAADQALKSFIALPIIDADGTLIGVLSCDSKKSYAFAKITEKVLIDCASQIAHLVSLHSKLRKRSGKHANTVADRGQEELGKFLEYLRNIPGEENLLNEAATLSQDLVERDALVIITSAQGISNEGLSFTNASFPGNAPARRSLGAGIFASPTNQPRVSNRLMELVCRHKRVLCGERNVHALTNEEKLQRSFISIPFRVMNREAGSINVLSPAFGSFSANEVSVLEKLAETLGREVELRRLRERCVSIQESTGLLPWKTFAAQAQARISENLAARRPCHLLRVRIAHLPLIEDRLGTERAQDLYQQILRLIDQVKGSGNIGAYLAGTDCLALLEGADAERIVQRLRLLLERLEVPGKVGGSALVSGKFSDELKKGFFTALVAAPKDGETLEQLASKTLGLLESKDKRSQEEYSHAVCW